MQPSELKTLRDLLVKALDGAHSHITFESVVKDFPEKNIGEKPSGAPHSAWQLLEHMRIAQWDILEFSRDPKHQSPRWPDEYWPAESTPSQAGAWQRSVKQYQSDAAEFAKLLQSDTDLFQAFPYADGQTLLREAVVVANHNSYHLGQLEYLKKQLQAD